MVPCGLLSELEVHPFQQVTGQINGKIIYQELLNQCRSVPKAPEQGEVRKVGSTTPRFWVRLLSSLRPALSITVNLGLVGLQGKALSGESLLGHNKTCSFLEGLVKTAGSCLRTNLTPKHSQWEVWIRTCGLGHSSCSPSCVIILPLMEVPIVILIRQGCFFSYWKIRQ